ncbi:hypothetical protein GUITHDRAFT_99872 [Guillardia theta CCMP2712]|uniref:Uncharacterized protein n=1 Tax=Guillardia theta (strain CCMP2712) TaxID=905079 RepID=L1K1R4_GUITC|nr:hypothetical protein GUITHDRAFT_99872 [Guillardia theta CCMP2712]EKX54390.1 hypothetical protein GUITHDRAFT_99872 [Guillardia theta CCMP2712]|eukprot:XP_005841370.1 hypothetical protein GUITHDRAFT_99872 [Guillardia theta CCMP2712]
MSLMYRDYLEDSEVEHEQYAPPHRVMKGAHGVAGMADFSSSLSEGHLVGAASDLLQESEERALEEKNQALEKKVNVLRMEIDSVKGKLERAAHLRNTCRRIQGVECRLVSEAERRQKSKCNGKGKVLLSLTALISMFAGCVVAFVGIIILNDPEAICRPEYQSPKICLRGKYFDEMHPPLGKEGYVKANESSSIVFGEASLHVCSRGTSEQSFLRRDDCDGCLCPLGSLWMHFKDERFFGNGDYCVPEKQWKDCISRWSCCAHKPNYCWDFIFDGARQDPKKDDYCVVVDSCSQHMACYAILQRFRRWELVAEYPAAKARTEVAEKFVVGVSEEEIRAVNGTLNVDLSMRGWGFPSSVLHLLKVAESSCPEEWKGLNVITSTRSLAAGQKHRTWQMVSEYKVIAKAMSGKEYLIANWKQRERKTFFDSF